MITTKEITEDSRNKDPKNLITEINNPVNPIDLKKKNSQRAWKYGYNAEHDLVVISKDGTIGSVYLIDGLQIAIPSNPDEIYKRSNKKTDQYWQRFELPADLAKIKTVSQFKNKPKEFKQKWSAYINEEFDRREYGFWFYNEGKPTYITGSNYKYLQWDSIDVGYPDYREANRKLWLFWEACKADNRSYGMIYLKIRRSGFSYMEASEVVNTGTINSNARVGILSKKGDDAKTMFTDKVVPIFTKQPFFFKPIQDGMDKPKTELAFRVPSVRLTKKSMDNDDNEDEIDGLDTTINWKNTGNNAYDGEKLLLLAHDESGKWEKPYNVGKNWTVTKTCLRLGRDIAGKCMMGSTVNELKHGGQEFKDLYYDSKVGTRNKNGQTISGLYALFIPMEDNMEGFIDKYGYPVYYSGEIRYDINDRTIEGGSIEYWEAEIDGLKNSPDKLNEHYRQYPRTESHAFRDKSESSIFDLTKIYAQVDYNDSQIQAHSLTRGSFSWRNGIQDTEVIWTPDRNGRFLVSWLPRMELRNRVITKNNVKYPGNEEIGSFGCDSYDISGTVDGVGSNGALHGCTKYHMYEAPVNEFFLEYIARPQTAEIFFEDVLMAIVFYGMPVLAENNKARLLFHLKNRGYRGFSMNRPDKAITKLSLTEKEIGGIPNSSEDIIQAHASAIGSYIIKYVGYCHDSHYRPADEIGVMPFNRTLIDWAGFDIRNRTKHDASISSGLAIMANQKELYRPKVEKSKISVTFARYDNTGSFSKKII